MPGTEKKQQAEQPKKQVAHKNNSFLLVLTLITALIAIAIALYTLQSNQQMQDTLSEDNKNLATEIKQLKEIQSQTQSQIDTKQEQLQKLTSKLNSKIANVTQQVETTLNQSNFQKEDWLLLKARYYIELAQVNAHWSTDYHSAIALLLQADEVLEQLHENKVYGIRQTIAKEVAQLKAIPVVDTVGILSKLDAAQNSINSLTTLSAGAEMEQSNNTSTDASTSGWKGKVQNSLNLLQKLVVVRRSNEEVKPLMSPLYEALIKESIRLNLQQAQWAVLTNNVAVYKLTIEQAVKNIERTFNTSSAKVTALLSQLKALQQIQFNQQQPEIGLALPLINQMIQDKGAK